MSPSHPRTETQGAAAFAQQKILAVRHVGPLKARCLVMQTCTLRNFPAKVGAAEMHRIEMRKSPGDRYPSNMEAIGIEIVGRARMPVGFKPIGKEATWPLEKLRGQRGIYDTPTAAQNQALSWLVGVLEDSMQIAPSEVFRHPVVSRKNDTEAAGANWNLPASTP